MGEGQTGISERELIEGHHRHHHHRLRIRAVSAAKAEVKADRTVPLIMVEEAAGTGRFPVVARVVPLAGTGTLVTKVAVVMVPLAVVMADSTTMALSDVVDWGCSDV